MLKEQRQLPAQTNARERFLYADRFFAQKERGNPATFIKMHEEWSIPFQFVKTFSISSSSPVR